MRLISICNQRLWWVLLPWKFFNEAQLSAWALFFLNGCPQVQMGANSGKSYTWVQSRCSHGLHCTIINEFIPPWRFAYVKLFFPMPHRWSFTIAKNPHTPQKLLGHSITIKHHMGTGLGPPCGATPPPAHCSCRHGETVPSSGRYLLLLIPCLTLFWVSLKTSIKRFPD